MLFEREDELERIRIMYWEDEPYGAGEMSFKMGYSWVGKEYRACPECVEEKFSDA